MKEDSKNNIVIKGARVHNLKSIDLSLPRNKFIVFTGLSGSGKSSLAFDTIYAEGQRRYVESLSVYARQFIGRLKKPEVDYIKGISPAIAIEQKVITRNPRSTVGTSTEIYEYLKLLYARIGKTFSPISGDEIKSDNVNDVVKYIQLLKKAEIALILSPVAKHKDRTYTEQLTVLQQQGYQRLLINNEVVRIDKIIENKCKELNDQKINVVVDRINLNTAELDLSQLSDSIQTCFNESQGACSIAVNDKEAFVIKRTFSDRFELDGITFEEPSAHFFSYNNPYGACKRCEGFGNIMGIDEDLVVPNKNLSIYDGAVVCWKGEKMSEWKNALVMHAYRFDFPIHRPYYELSKEEKEILWNGNQYFEGINTFFQWVEEQQYKIQYRVMLSRYRGKTVCPDCEGTRLRKDASYVKVFRKSINELVLMPVERLLGFFKTIELNDYDTKVSKRLLIEIVNRLQFLNDVGLGYLTLNRLSSSLSGGESQRINLATSLGSCLVGSMYILDEPSIGLHSRDTQKLLTVLKQLQKNGNTVIVVEHDEEIIKASDQIVDIGPRAGRLGGEIVFQGTYKEMIQKSTCLTARYMNGKLKIDVPVERRKWKEYIEVIGAIENNLKNVNVKFPLRVMTVVTGVSGSGKTSLVKNVLYSALKKMLGENGGRTGKHSKLDGDITQISSVEMIDQNPIGRSSRSNPVTYVGAYDDIRTLFAEQKLAKVRGYKPGYFSFNVPGGRCEECEGDGFIKVEMQFMADIQLVCENCEGKRFKQEVLDVKYKGKSISDVLDLTIDDAIEYFSSNDNANHEKKILSKLQPLSDVGLGYVKLGQSSSTLSGGEAQRIKLAYFLIKGVWDKPTLFIFDEPTTGLHFHDIHKLNYAFNALLEKGHTVIIIEHNTEVIKCADWVIDIGPEGGDEGGHIVFEGTPEQLVKCEESHTAFFLKDKL